MYKRRTKMAVVIPTSPNARVTMVKTRVEYPLAPGDPAALVPWKWCGTHEFKYLYAPRCPFCLAKEKETP